MNKIVEFFKTQVGKEVTESPSPVGRWLKATLIEVDEGKLVADIVVREENLHFNFFAFFDGSVMTKLYAWKTKVITDAVNNSISGYQIDTKRIGDARRLSLVHDMFRHILKDFSRESIWIYQFDEFFLL